jgi:hypothetical protein
MHVESDCGDAVPASTLAPPSEKTMRQSFITGSSSSNRARRRGLIVGIVASVCALPQAVADEPADAVQGQDRAGTQENEEERHGGDHLLAGVISLARSGRVDEAEQFCRSVLRNSPDDQNAYRSLVWLAKGRALPASSAASRSAQQRLSDQFNVFQTERFVLLSDADTAVTQQHARWVERACEEFQRFVDRCDLRPLPLEHKLVCVLFEDYAEYQAFARSHDGMVNPAFSGYYSPRNDRVVFSLQPQHAVDSENQRGSKTSGKSILGFDGSKAQGARDACADDSCGVESAAKCVHETIHQLMFHTRIMTPDVQYPLWICEGLSTAFETDSPDEAFGPDCSYAPRREAFSELLDQDHLIPVSELVTLTQIPNDRPRMLRAVYHQSYALVTWLVRERPADLRDYLAAMLREPAGKLSAARHAELFEHAFGGATGLEREWLMDERSRAW